METPAHIAAQRIVGGSLALDLLNTQNGPAGGTPEDDALRDYGDVVAWGVYVGMLGLDEAERLVGGHAGIRTPLARSSTARSRRAPTYTRCSRDRERPEPACRCHRPVAARRGRGAGPWGARPRRRRLRVALGGRRPGATALAGRPRGPEAPHGRPPGPRQGLRDVSVPLPRPEQEPEPTVVFDGRLRHRRQDAELRRAAGVRPLGGRPDLAEELEAVNVDAAVAEGADGDGMPARRRPDRAEDHAPEPRLRGVEVHRAAQDAVHGDRRPP